MTYGIDKLALDLGAVVAANVKGVYDSGVPGYASPIEALFATGFLTFLAVHPDYMDYRGRMHSGVEDPVEDYDFFLSRQARVLNWPVDFLIFAKRHDAPSDPCARLVIECDGHDFHERTKEQAARDRSRDRALQASGYTIMRFTGSELYRDPTKCVREALDWCVARYWER